MIQLRRYDDDSKEDSNIVIEYQKKILEDALTLCLLCYLNNTKQQQ